MAIRSGLVTILLMIGLSGCDTLQTLGTVGSTSAAVGSTVETEAPEAAYSSVTVTRIEVDVPETLTVSEANVLVPMSDIVWRGDPLGDRREQIKTVILDAAQQATAELTDGRPVVLYLEVVRFHALTEKARYMIGGNHALRFVWTLRDAATGEVIDGPRDIKADQRAAGGVRALAEENAGLTEKVVITERLKSVFNYELTHLVLEPAG